MISDRQQPCVFCAKPREELILDTPEVIAFLDIFPLVSAQAHILVVPRKHFETLDELAADPEASAQLGIWIPRVSKALKDIVGSSSAFNVVQNNGGAAGQVVPHVHFHIVLRNSSITDISAIVVKLRQQFSWKERLRYSAIVYGKGERYDAGAEFKKLEHNLRTRLDPKL